MERQKQALVYWACFDQHMSELLSNIVLTFTRCFRIKVYIQIYFLENLETGLYYLSRIKGLYISSSFKVIFVLKAMT